MNISKIIQKTVLITLIFGLQTNTITAFNLFNLFSKEKPVAIVPTFAQKLSKTFHSLAKTGISFIKQHPYVTTGITVATVLGSFYIIKTRAATETLKYVINQFLINRMK
jgi:hypothetical protein